MKPTLKSFRRAFKPGLRRAPLDLNLSELTCHYFQSLAKESNTKKRNAARNLRWSHVLLDVEHFETVVITPFLNFLRYCIYSYYY